jgi:hypothetical protein
MVVCFSFSRYLTQTPKALETNSVSPWRKSWKKRKEKEKATNNKLY